jgi:pimeloyl-ACP methyl ester carboxylesterase
MIRRIACCLLAWPLIAAASPPIVLQAGLGDDHRAWQAIEPALARDHRVIALDRPGRGTTPDTTAPRDPCTIATEQRAQLQAAGLAPPYVLVGHSLGGTYQFVYAKLYPQDVAGLVLVDATPLGHWERMKQEAPESALLLRAVRTLLFSSVDRREFDDQATCLDRLDLQQPLNRPVRVLVAGRFNAGDPPEFRAMMQRSRPTWLPLTGAPALQTVPDAGHYIQKDKPQAVIGAILAVLAEAGERAAPAPTPAATAR